jgi:hypothetical protein
MPSLRDLQAAMAADLLAPRPPRRTGYLQASAAEGPLRLGVYRNNLRSAFQAALEAAYPVVRQLVGDNYFRLLARRYLHAHPARGGAMATYGEAFAELLAVQPELAALPWVAHTARLEWCRQRCGLAAEAPVLATAELAAVPMERIPALRFRFADSSSRLDSRWPVDEVWAAHRDGDPGRANVDAGPVSLLLHRRGGGVVCRRLDAAERAFIDALSAGAPLEAACEAAGAGADPVAWLPALAAAGVITGFDDPGAPRP